MTDISSRVDAGMVVWGLSSLLGSFIQTFQWRPGESR